MIEVRRVKLSTSGGSLRLVIPACVVKNAKLRAGDEMLQIAVGKMVIFMPLAMTTEETDTMLKEARMLIDTVTTGKKEILRR